MYKLLSLATVALTVIACDNYTTFSHVDAGEAELSACHQLEGGLELCVNFEAECYTHSNRIDCFQRTPEPAAFAPEELHVPATETVAIDGFDINRIALDSPIPELEPEFVQRACNACRSDPSTIACRICQAARQHYEVEGGDTLDDTESGDIDTDNANAPDHIDRF